MSANATCQKLKVTTGERDAENIEIPSYSDKLTADRPDTVKLCRSSENFCNIYDASPMGIHLYELQADDRLIFIGANAAADRILGMDSRHFIGKDIDDVFPASIDSGIAGRYRVICTDGGIWESEQVEYEDSRIKGAYEVYAFQTAPGMMAAMFWDVTEGRKAKDALGVSEERYRVIFDQAAVGIAHTSPQGNFLMVNQRFCDLLGYDQQELQAMTLKDLTHPDDFKKERTNLVKMLDDQIKVHVMEKRLYRKDGSQIWGRATISLVKDPAGQPRYFIGILEDITDRKYMEDALRIRERQLSEKTRHLEEVNQALKAMLDHREVEKRSIEESMLLNLKKLVFPYLDSLQNCKLDNQAQTYLSIISANLEDLFSPLSSSLFAKYLDFTPTEINVADYIRQGKSSKQISELMNVSPSSIAFHRNNIRKKLGLSQKSINLNTYLNSLTK